MLKTLENLSILEGKISRDSSKKISALKNDLKKELSTFDTNIEKFFKKGCIKGAGKKVQVEVKDI